MLLFMRSVKNKVEFKKKKVDMGRGSKNYFLAGKQDWNQSNARDNNGKIE